MAHKHMKGMSKGMKKGMPHYDAKGAVKSGGKVGDPPRRSGKK